MKGKSLVTIDGLLMIDIIYHNLFIDRLYRSLILSFLYEEELDVSLASPTSKGSGYCGLKGFQPCFLVLTP